MDTSVHAYIDQIEQKSLSSSEDKNSVVAESDRNTHEVAISQEDFDAWFDAFCSRYAETLEYLQSH